MDTTTFSTTPQSIHFLTSTTEERGGGGGEREMRG
jgi:hypothetical protein